MPARGGGREQRAAGLRVVRLTEATQPLDGAAHGEFARGESDAGEATEAALGYGGRRRLARH
jgi:hypothetical protein